MEGFLDHLPSEPVLWFSGSMSAGRVKARANSDAGLIKGSEV